MTVKGTFRDVVSEFNAVTPFTNIKRDDIENCKALSKATGLEWSPHQLSLLNPIELVSIYMSKRNDVEYRGYINGREGDRSAQESYAFAAANVINKALEGAVDTAESSIFFRASGHVNIFGEPYVGVYAESERSNANLMNLMAKLDPNQLNQDMSDAFAQVESRLRERDMKRDTTVNEVNNG